MKLSTGLCQDDVTTSSDDVISRNKLHVHVREKILRKTLKVNNRSLYNEYELVLYYWTQPFTKL